MAQLPSGYRNLTLKAYREDDQYVSECVELGVASCGATVDEAFDALLEAVEVYLDTIAEEGELIRLLRERDIALHFSEPPEDGPELSIRARPPEIVSPRRVRLPALA